MRLDADVDGRLLAENSADRETNMEARSVRNAADARELVKARGLSHVKIGVSDVDGIIRGKYMARDKFFSALESGVKFCDVIFGWDLQRSALRQVDLHRRHTAFPDAHRADRSKAPARDVPLEGDMLFFLGEFDGPAAAVCPRRLFRRVISSRGEPGLLRSVAVSSSFSSSTRRRIACAKRATATSRASPRAGSAIRCCAPRSKPTFITP